MNCRRAITKRLELPLKPSFNNQVEIHEHMESVAVASAIMACVTIQNSSYSKTEFFALQC